MDYRVAPLHNPLESRSGHFGAPDYGTWMLMVAPSSRIAGIVAELGRLLLDRQALVHQLEALAPLAADTQPTRAECSAQLGQLVARQKRLLDELAAIQPPSGKSGS